MNVWCDSEIWRRLKTCSRCSKYQRATISGCYTPLCVNYMRIAKLRHQKGAAGSSSSNLGVRVRAWDVCVGERETWCFHIGSLCALFTVLVNKTRMSLAVRVLLCQTESFVCFCLETKFNMPTCSRQDLRLTECKLGIIMYTSGLNWHNSSGLCCSDGDAGEATADWAFGCMASQWADGASSP